MICLSEAESVLDFLPLIAIICLMPLIVIISPVVALDQLNVYRVQHFDLHNNRFGSRQSSMNLESISVSQINESFAKKCVIFKINDLLNKMETFEKIIDETLAAGVLIIIPKTLYSLNGQQLQQFLAFEKSLVNREIHIPLYLTFETKEVIDIYESQPKDPDIVANEDNKLSNVKTIYDKLMANGWQLVVNNQINAIKDIIITNIQGKLIGGGIEDQMPTIALVAHYDAFSAVPALSFGADSNGSGIVALIEMIRLFSKLYSNPKTQPKVNLLFVMSGAGKFNYMGTKKWIEEHLDSSDSTLLTDSLFTVCLDSLGDSDGNNGLFMHVSKPPKEGSPVHQMLEHMKQIASKSLSHSFNVSMIHKKINLAEENLSWEHERFSIRRLSAFTLSSLSTHKSLRRKSMTDVFDEKLFDPLLFNIHVISEAMVRLMYKDFESNLFDNDLRISKQFVKSVLNQLSRQSRPQQSLLSVQKGSQIEISPLVRSLEQMMRRYVSEVELIHSKVDNKDNELVFYEPLESVLNIYNVKPAVFDLFVSMAIATYLLVFFALLSNFHFITSLTKKLVSNEYNSRF